MKQNSKLKGPMLGHFDLPHSNPHTCRVGVTDPFHSRSLRPHSQE